MKGTGKRVLVAGAGASGLCAAIFAARAGAGVTVIEKTDTAGKKLSMTGNGRCNLSNTELSPDGYNCDEADRRRMDTFLGRFGVKQTQDFFLSAGLLTRDENGLIYPASGQASTVTTALVEECARLGIDIIFREQVKAVNRSEDGRLCIKTNKGLYDADAFIMATGGMAGPSSTASTGDGYYICGQIGMSCSDRRPALVNLRCDDKTLPTETGVRVKADISFMSGDEFITKEYGELQITSDGISGIPVMQASGKVAGYLENGAGVTAFADLFPEYTEDEFEELVKTLTYTCTNRTLKEFTGGFANAHLGLTVLSRMGLDPDGMTDDLDPGTIEKIIRYYRSIPFEITGTGGYARAQVTSGGVKLSCLDDDLQSVNFPGVYCAGELLDVDGRCGGYNLQWAWCSGAIAGSAAAGKRL